MEGEEGEVDEEGVGVVEWGLEGVQGGETRVDKEWMRQWVLWENLDRKPKEGERER